MIGICLISVLYYCLFCRCCKKGSCTLSLQRRTSDIFEQKNCEAVKNEIVDECKHCCCCCCQTTSDEQDDELTESQCKHSFLSNLHTTLGIIFPGLTKRIVKIESETASCKQKVLLLFAGRIGPKKRLQVVHVYLVFWIMAALITYIWFIVILIENIIYRKTTTCNDVNVRSNRSVCFDVRSSKGRVNCKLKDSGDLEVFCYLVQPSFAAFGVAFSIAKGVSLIFDLEFRIVVRVADYTCGRVVLAGLQVVSFTIMIFWTIFLPLAKETNTKLSESILFDNYFFLGGGHMRRAIAVLISLSISLALCVPWCYFKQKNGKEYLDQAVDIELAESASNEITGKNDTDTDSDMIRRCCFEWCRKNKTNSSCTTSSQLSQNLLSKSGSNRGDIIEMKV